jgi:hypothetical protein
MCQPIYLTLHYSELVFEKPSPRHNISCAHAEYLLIQDIIFFLYILHLSIVIRLLFVAIFLVVTVLLRLLFLFLSLIALQVVKVF